jgi:hypothetical protein
MRKLHFSSALSLLAGCLIILTAAVGASAQYKGSPVKKDKLVNVLKSRQLQTREIVRVIKSNGVDFQVSEDVEEELVGAGARPEVIAAAKANYRAPVGVARNNTTNAAPSKFTGDPITKDAIITLLQNGVPDAQVRKNVGARGVNFKPSPTDQQQIRNAGGTVALINLIAASYVNPNQNAAANNDTAANGSDKYDELVEKAVVQYDSSKDVKGAISTLQQAISTDANEARAYQQLGYMYLYGQKNFAEAEKYMQEAINRGGSAVFRVFHDHGALMTSVCQGSLFIAKDTVRFESDDNIHTFEAADTDIKEAKMNNRFAAMFNAKAGAFRVVLKSGDKNKNFNFAPLTDSPKESEMIVRLIGKK